MAEVKTNVNDGDVKEFLNAIPDDQKRNDCLEINRIMQEITGESPRMWGSSIIGYGAYTYTYASGKKGDWMLTGFSPRKQNLTLYIMSGFEHSPDLMDKLGKFKTGKSCLYINRLTDVDHDILEQLIRNSITHLLKQYPRV